MLEAPNLRGVIFLVEGNAPLFGVEDGTWDLKKNGGTATRGWSLVDSKKKILEVNMFVLRVCIYIYRKNRTVCVESEILDEAI